MNPDAQLLEQAMGRYRAGQLPLAEDLCRQILGVQPEHAHAMHLLGVCALGSGRADQACHLLRDAIRHYKQASDLAEANHNLGVASASIGRLDDAATAFRRSLELRPDSAETWQSLGNVCRQTGDIDAAVAAFRQVISLRPDGSKGFCSLGETLALAGRLFEAVSPLRRAAALEPRNPTILYNLALILADCRQNAESLELYLKTLDLRPAWFLARVNFALLLAAMGRAGEGWKIFFEACDLDDPLATTYPDRRWKGDDPGDKTILVYSDSNFGDAILLSRFVPLLRQRGAKIILQCRKELAVLFESLKPDQILTLDQTPPAFDSYVMLWSLPVRMEYTLNTAPRQTPYLSPPPQRVRNWSGRLPMDGTRKIGLVWAASDRLIRSRDLHLFQPLCSIPGFRFVSLQKGRESNQNPPPGMDLIDLTSEIHDFADTAALIQQLDLVISVDTSPAHLAGALGKPVWVLIAYHSNFLWLLDRTDSIWYPSMRLFRQKDPQDWSQPIQEIAEALRQFQP